MRAVIFANGKLENQELVTSLLRSDDYLIAADGGAAHCKVLNINPDVVIGDMDSISSRLVEELQSSGTRFLTYPQDKDKTDLELALTFSQKIGADKLLLIGILGGRLDMSLANLLLLTKNEWSNAEITVIQRNDVAYLINNSDPFSLEGKTGDKVSLIPLSEKVEVVYTRGLRWKLHDDELSFGDTRGVSNELIAEMAEIKIKSGKLFIVHCNSLTENDQE